MIDKFGNIFYLIIYLVHFIIVGSYAFQLVFGTQKFLEGRGVDKTATLITRFAGSFMIAMVLMAIYIAFIRSGGLDSTLVAYELKKVLGNLDTFTNKMSPNVITDEDHNDDAIHAARFAKDFGMNHTEITITPKATVKVTLDSVIGAGAFLLLEEVLSGITEYWQLFFGPMLIFIVIFVRGGIDGILVFLDTRWNRYNLKRKLGVD